MFTILLTIPTNVDKLFIHPVGIFCSLLERTLKCKIMQQNKFHICVCVFLLFSLYVPHRLIKGLPFGPVLHPDS